MNGTPARRPKSAFSEMGVRIKEVSDGRPCDNCPELCPGFIPHAWRKTCKSCGCDRLKHSVYHEELGSVRDRLGLRESRVNHHSYDSPPGLTAKQTELFWSSLADRAPTAVGGATGAAAWRAWRTRALATQLPKQDLSLAHCVHIDEGHRKQYEDFVAARNEIALDIGVASQYHGASMDCMGCNKPIRSGSITVQAPRIGEDAYFHPSCFSCADCDELLVELAYCALDGRLYCVRHYAERLKPRCHACDELVIKMNRPGTSGVKHAASKENESVPATKKKRETRPPNKDQEEAIMEWLNESSESDSDDIDPNFIAGSDHDSASEQEGSDSELAEEQEIEINEANQSRFYFGKNRFKWSKAPFNTSGVRTPRHNIVAASATSSSTLSEADPKDALNIWRKFFDDSIYQEILTWTNSKLQKYRASFKNVTELHDIDEIELNAFLGLLLYSAVFKSNHEDCDLLYATDGTGRDIFRCVISKNRFMYLLNCLRFDNPDTRLERQKENKTAAISFVFNKFVNNCRKNYNMGINATIDEMLIGFRGRSHFIIYMPQKPAKYGLKVQAICDSKTFYFYDGYIYSGKGSDGEGLTEEEKKLQVPTQCVLRLIRDLHGSNRNITADNWYSSMQCVEELKKRGLTFVGTLKKNKREIPPELLPKKTRDIGSTLYGFTKDITLVSHVPKKNKAVLLLSSMHHNEEMNEEVNKPEIISYYNSTKGGVDELDKKCSIYNSSRRTRRWSMAIFFRILDLSAVNAGILYNYHSHDKIADRSVFLKLLARSLVVPQMQRRFLNKHLPRELLASIKRVLGTDAPEDVREDNQVAEGNQTRKLCHICPSRLKRKTAYKCDTCMKHVCLQCSKPVCKECL